MTVSACSKCHDSFKLDDEYFLLTLSMRGDLPDRAESTFLKEKTQRTLRDPRATAFRTALQAAVKRVPVRVPGSTDVIETTLLRIDGVRIQRTANRIVRGLHAKYFGKVLPATHELTVHLFDFQRDNSAVQHPQVKELFSLLKQHGTNHKFGPVLDVWYASAEDDGDSCFWAVCLHGAFELVAFTIPNDER